MSVYLQVAPGSYEKMGDFLKLLRTRGIKVHVQHTPSSHVSLQLVVESDSKLPLVLDLAEKNKVKFISQ